MWDGMGWDEGRAREGEAEGSRQRESSAHGGVSTSHSIEVLSLQLLLVFPPTHYATYYTTTATKQPPCTRSSLNNNYSQVLTA